MDVVKIIGIALIGCIAALLIKTYFPGLSVLLSILTGAVILLIAFEAVKPVLTMVNDLFSATGLTADYGKTVVKALGVCLLAGFAADSCRDAGEKALANKVELVCKIAVTAMALPMFEELLGIAKELIK